MQTNLLMRLHLKRFSYRPLDIHDGAGVSNDLATVTFWPHDELASGNFTECSAGFIDVSSIPFDVIRLKLEK